jgi:hypothetical protein
MRWRIVQSASLPTDAPSILGGSEVKVLIVGSLDHLKSEDRQSFIAACKDIGAALARAKFEFVVGSSGDNTADKWIIEGAASVEGDHKVCVFRPEHGSTPSMPFTGDTKGRFHANYTRTSGLWEDGRVLQIQAADCVLIIGGAEGTSQTGYSAAALEKPVVAVASFGGAAANMWNNLAPFYKRLSKTREQIGYLREDWQSGNEAIIVKVLTELVRRRVFSRNRLGTELSPLVLNLALFIAWVLLWVAPGSHRQESFFALLAVSAFLGTSLRGSLRMMVDPAESRTRSALIAEYSAGLVLAFALALLYLIGSFTFTGNFEAIKNGQTLDAYQRVAVMMGLFGIAGGWLLERVAESLTGWLGSRLP